MDTAPNYYHLLHVQPDAPREIIRSSYRTVMQKLRAHPDLGGDRDHAAIINEAYAVLSDPHTRAAYDESRSRDEPAAASRLQRLKGFLGQSQPQHCFCEFCDSLYPYHDQLSADALCLECHSPLNPALPLKIEDEGRRAVARFAKHEAITFFSQWPQAQPFVGRCNDLSLNGMRFYSGHDLEQGHIIKIDCDLLKAVGRVTHSQQDDIGYTTGVQFMSLYFAQTRGSFIAVQA